MNALSLLLAVGLLRAQGPQPMPDVALTDMKGGTVRLSDFRGKKVVMFNWASW